MTAESEEDSLTVQDVEVLKQEAAFQGYFRLDRYRLRHRKFDGGWSTPMTREVLERGHAVAIILYDPEKDVLVMIKQFRPGAYAALSGPPPQVTFSPWLIEWVAGIIDPGETAENVARREAMEEAGCEVGAMEFVQLILATPGCSSETIAFYAGQVRAPETGGIHGLDYEHEDIRVILVSPTEAFQWLDEGRIINASTVVGLQWFRVHHQTLRARWIKSLAQKD
jgi:ADP-ribose pyrophosphatase